MISAQEAQELGIEGVIYGLPLVLMDRTRLSMTNSPPPRDISVNQFGHLKAFPTAAFKQVVRANVDTLYSSAFLSLSQEPLVLSVPDTQGRYYLLPMFDAWSNVFATPGTRTTGNGVGEFLIVGPRFAGTAPAGMQVLRSPTDMVWILGRTQTNGPSDYPAVHAIQDSYKLVPLSKFGTPYMTPKVLPDPTVDVKTPPVAQVMTMSTANYLNSLAQLLACNPPAAADAPLIAKLARIGLIPGQPFKRSGLSAEVGTALDAAAPIAFRKLQQATKCRAGNGENGWYVPPMSVGNFRTNYQLRAIIALIAFGANLPQDAVYPTAFVDGEGRALNGESRYVLHFGKGQLPPVNAFWSVTLYGSDSFFVDNSLNRYAISSWMALHRANDGSLDLYIQPDSPGEDLETNWLPAPKSDFNLTLRLYWPKDKPLSILDGTWSPPAIKRLDQ